MIQPIGDQIVIKLVEAKSVSEGGIVLPNAVQTERRGEVIAKGPGRYLKSGKRAPIDLEIGDIVLYGAAGGTPFNLGEFGNIMIMKSSEIVAIIND